MADGASPDLPGPTSLRAVKLIGGGRALAHHDGATWMIRGGLPGELLRTLATRRRAGVIEAEADEILADSHPARLVDPCPHSDTCGGCDWPHVDCKAGAPLKAVVAAESTGRYPDLSDRLRLAPVTPSPPSYRLRSRLHWDPRSEVLGFYGPRNRRVSPISSCRIITSALLKALPALTQQLAARCPAPVDVEWIEGDDGAVAALRPAKGGPKTLPTEWIPAQGTGLGIVGFHRLTKRSRIVRGWGRVHVHMDLPIRLAVPVGAFFQGNRHLVRWLFDRVGELIGPGVKPIFDIHGGVGFLAAAARQAGRKTLTVVEPHEPGAEAAEANLPGARVVRSTAEAFLARADNLEADATVIADPPRIGMSPELRSQLAEWRPRRILMLGCDPATWGRDTAFLIERDYRLTHLEMVDLFPFTHHVEIIAAMEVDR